MLPEKGYKRIIVICFYIALVLLLCYFFFNYLLKWLWPIFVALLIGVIVQPVVRFLKKKLRFPGKLAAVLVVLVLYFGLGYLAFVVIYNLIKEISSLAAYVPNYILKLNIDLGNIEEFAKGLLAKIPIFKSSELLESVWSGISNSIISFLQSLSETILKNVTPMLTSIVQLIPSLILSIVIMIVSSVYFVSDYDKIKDFFAAQLSEKTRNRISDVKNHFFRTIVRYLRAYLLLMLITAVELYLGFTVIGQQYALLLAIAISIIDVLPVLGTGTVLIPWGVILIVTGGTVKGIEILVLYVAITVIRQILEPKIVGEYIGLYPLITLVAMYAGLRSIGLFGMFMFPVTIIILKELNQNGSVRLWKEVPGTDDKKEPAGAKFVKKLKEKKNRSDRSSPEKPDGADGKDKEE